MLYSVQCWAVKSQQENQVSVKEMRMLCWMSGGKSRRDIIRTDTIRERGDTTYCRKVGKKIGLDSLGM